MENFREGLGESLLTHLETRDAQGERVAELQPVEAWHAGYQLGLMEALAALEQGGEIIAEHALERFSKAQN